MIKNNKRVLLTAAVLAVIAGIFIFSRSRDKSGQEAVTEIRPEYGSIKCVVTSTATVKPQNRLEVKPPINGRVEKILVKEGQKVKSGEIIAWMSATERAALLDAARANGEEAYKHWEDVYKPTPLIAPINGEVIVSTDQPGQTITSSDVVLVISDKLIVQAQVDETDIGKVAVGQDAAISLDAYPEIKVNGKVDHIFYESTTTNNVTIYQVDILPETVPPVFRSGMNATVDIVETAKDNILIIPHEVVKKKGSENYVMVSRGPGASPEEKKIVLGISDDKNVEVVSGLTADDRIISTAKKYVLPSGETQTGKNPFMPQPPGGNKK